MRLRRCSASLLMIAFLGGSRPVTILAQQPYAQPQSNWSSVRELAPGTQIVLAVRGGWRATVTVRQVDDAAIAVQTKDSNHTRVAREDVIEIALPPHRSIGRALGLGAAGAGVGFLLAFRISYKNCGESCSDERALMTLSLVGLPVGLGLAGYYSSNNSRVIYRR